MKARSYVPLFLFILIQTTGGRPLRAVDVADLERVTTPGQKELSPWNPRFILFTSADCSECKLFEDQLTEVQEDFEKAIEGHPETVIKESGLKLGKFNPRKSQKVVDNLQLHGVPSLILVLSDGTSVEYSGSLEADDMMEWAAKFLRDVFERTFDDEKLLDDYIKTKEVCVVAYVDEKSKAIIAQTVKSLRQIVSYVWVDSEPKRRRLEMAKIGAGARLVLDLVEGDLESPNRQNDIVEWILKNQIPFFGVLDLSNLDAYLTETKPMIWLIGSEAIRNQLREELLTSYEKQKDLFGREFWFVWINPEGSEVHRDFIEGQLKPRKRPALVMTDLDGAGRFYFDGDIGQEGWTGEFESWLKKVLKGEIKRELLSEPVPAESVDNLGFSKLVTDSLASALKNVSNHPFLLLVESPFCQHCGLVLQLMKGNVQESVKCMEVGRLNGAVNELDPQWKLPMSPGIYFFPVQPEVDKLEQLQSEPIPEALFSGEGSTKRLSDWLGEKCKCGIVGEPEKVVRDEF